MESKEYEELLQKINSMQAEIDQQKSVINEYDSRLKGVKGDLYSQEHRFIPAWLNVILHYKNKETEHSKEKWSAVLQGFLPGTKSTIVIGGSIVGLLTIVLMYQSNQLMLLQNQYLQQQIYIQADSDRRDQLVNIMEKLYEPSDYYADLYRSTEKKETLPPVDSKYNSNTRSQSVLAYLNIKHHPLKSVEVKELDSIFQISLSLWNSFWNDNPQQAINTEVLCDSIDKINLEEVDLSSALLMGVNLSGACLKLANLKGADFERANLANANLTGAQLERAYMARAYLDSVNMSQAKLLFANFSQAHLNNAKFNSADLAIVNMQGARMHGADFQNASLSSASANGALLQNAILKGASLKDTILMEANIEGADFTGAKDLTCEQLTSAKNWRLAITDLKCEEPEVPEQAEK